MSHYSKGILPLFLLSSCQRPVIPLARQADPQLTCNKYQPKPNDKVISRTEYPEKLYGFWPGQCIANWTGLVTEMDKIGGAGKNGEGAGFYTLENSKYPEDHVLYKNKESL